MSEQNICNICGANYAYRNGRWVCPACGAWKVEALSNEEVTLLYNAAQRLWLCDFAEAEDAYSDIVQKYPENSDAYWGRVLSRYGIKYEDDFDGRKIPTCYAASIESVLQDRDYKRALELADAEKRAHYEQQAAYIERVRREWVEKAKKEKPYDIFICYKDSDIANGIERTRDSVAAQELYLHLKEKGYRVFFSRETLREKTGEKYEPYIFNALSTARMMLVYASNPDYITSTWLKNEWTRYKKRMENGEKPQNSLIVACDGFAPALLPRGLADMQCLDATRPSFYSDVEKLLTQTRSSAKGKRSLRRRLAVSGIAAGLALAIGLGTLRCYAMPQIKYSQMQKTYAAGDCISLLEDLQELSEYEFYMKNFLPEDNIYDLFYGTDRYVILSNGTVIGTNAVANTEHLQIPVYRDGEWANVIADNAFAGQDALKSVYIPGTVNAIGAGAFSNCTFLTEVKWEKPATRYKCYGVLNVDGVSASLQGMYGEVGKSQALTIGETAFAGCTSLQTIILPESLTSVGTSAFYGCTSLQTVTLPESLTSVGTSAFSGCTSLQTVTLPEGVKSVEMGAFSACQSLKTVVCSGIIPRFGGTVFKNCISLESVSFLKGVDANTGFFMNLFSKCPALKEIHFGDVQANWRSSWSAGHLGLAEGQSVTVYCTDGSFVLSA